MKTVYIVLVRENHGFKRIQFETESFADALKIKRALGGSSMWAA